MVIIFLFLFGLSVGSFLNVVIDRLPHGKTIIKGRSCCDHCLHTLSWYDLIPLVSFILLGRKCRYCKKKISWQYPLVEFITGVLFLLTYTLPNQFVEVRSDYFANILFSYYLVIISGLIVIFFTDLKFRIIPDQVIILLISSTLIFNLANNQISFVNYFLSGLAMFGLFLGLFLVTRGRGMGFGDVKFSFFMGVFLGFPKIIIGFYISFLTGAALSLILVIAKKKTMKSTIPFGPFLVTATAISMFYGRQIWIWFKPLIGL